MPYDAYITENEFLAIEDSLIDYDDSDDPDIELIDGWLQVTPLFTDPNVITDTIPF